MGVCWVSGYRNSHKNPKLVAVGHIHTFDDSLDCRIVDPQTCIECSDKTIGELWISSLSVAAGYWGKEALSESVFRAQLLDRKDGSASTFLRTGDLAFIEDDHLYICGRIKDLIIIGGRNYYPQDVGLATQEADICIRPGCVAAFCLNDTKSDGEVAVVFEVKSSSLLSGGSSGQKLRDVISNVNLTVSQKTGITLARIVAISEGSIPKTTSGKIQRKASREALKSEKLSVLFDMHFGDGALLATETMRAPSNGQFDAPLKQSSTTAAAVHSSPLEICSAFGVFEMSATLSENGMCSMRQMEFLERLRERCGLNISFYKALSLPIGVLLSGGDCGTGMNTRQVCEEEIKAIGLDPSSLEARRDVTLQRGVQRVVFDTFSVFVLLCMVAASVVCAFGAMWKTSFYIPIPTCYGLWCINYSVLVFAAKWIQIGQYKEAHIPFQSMAFYCWWLVDRLVHIWEMFVGGYVFGTYWLWLFYYLLGADLPMGCHIHSYLREFDLISVGSLNNSINDEEEEHRGGRRITILRGQVRGSRMTLGAIRLAHVRIEKGSNLHPDAWVVPQLLSAKGKGEDFSTVVETSDARYCRHSAQQPHDGIPRPQTQWGEVLQMWISPLVVIGVLSTFHSHLLVPLLENWMLHSSTKKIQFIASTALLPLMSLAVSRVLCSVGGNATSFTAGAFFAPFNHVCAFSVDYGPLSAWVYRFFGARIGNHSIITEIGLVSPIAMKYLSVGDRCTIGKCFLSPLYVEEGSSSTKCNPPLEL